MTFVWIKMRDEPFGIDADPKPIDDAFLRDATYISLVDSLTGRSYRFVLSEIQAWSS